MNKSLKILLAILLLSISGRAYTQVDTIVWQQLSPLPDGIQRFEPGCFLIDSDFFVAGGQIGTTGIYISTLWRYNISTDTWYQMSNLPFGAADAGASFAINGKGYFLTARDEAQNGNCDKMFWQYDPITDLWMRMADFPDSPRQNSAFFTYAGKGYVGETGGCAMDDNHFWVYEPDSNKWAQISSLPSFINGIGNSEATTTQPYLLGGYYVGGTNSCKNLWRYDTLNDVWNALQPISNHGRLGSLLLGFDSILIAGGGIIIDTGIYLGYDYYKYTIATNIWSPVVFINSFDSTALGYSFVYNKLGYYFGGYSSLAGQGIISNNLWSFDASGFFPPDTPTGIGAIKNTVTFSLYPNPVSHEQGFSVSTSESGSISFHDALGRMLDERRLLRGVNQVKLVTNDEVIFYHATLSSGAAENGKVVFIK